MTSLPSSWLQPGRTQEGQKGGQKGASAQGEAGGTRAEARRIVPSSPPPPPGRWGPRPGCGTACSRAPRSPSRPRPRRSREENHSQQPTQGPGAQPPGERRPETERRLEAASSGSSARCREGAGLLPSHATQAHMFMQKLWPRNTCRRKEGASVKPLLHKQSADGFFLRLFTIRL